jgi:hypothetical protein
VDQNTLADGRKVKFTYQELLVVGAFITAQIAGNEGSIRWYWTKQKTGLVVKMLKAISRASFQRSSSLWNTLCVTTARSGALGSNPLINAVTVHKLLLRFGETIVSHV